MDSRNKAYYLEPIEQELGIRLDKFLSQRLSEMSRTQIQNIIKNNFVKENDIVINNSSYKIKQEKYQIFIPPAQENIIKGNDIELDIVYEDDDVILINKQPGLVTHPGIGNYDNTLVNGLITYLGDNLSSIGGVERPGIVHRLDKDTSGLIIVAKNDLSHQSLSEQLQTRELKRIYHAICWKIPMPKIGKIETYMRRHKTNRLKMEVHKDDGKIAITNYRVLSNFEHLLSLVECSLQTGRTHQIRVHMSHIKNPIIGDTTYASGHKNAYMALPEELQQPFRDFPRQALHAKKIGFIHPRTNELMEFEIDYETKMKELINIMSQNTL